MQTQEALFQTLKSGIENRDVDALVSCYQDQAEIRIIDQDHPPSSPRVIRGREAITDFYRDICARDMTHRVELYALGDRTLALEEACEYSTGMKVAAAEFCELEGDKILRETIVQAWDA